jgi:formylglycine-generating enzyme required for sulfatase activity
MRRRRIILLVLLPALLAGGTVISWNALGKPPVGLVWKYGYPSPMGPTGRKVVIEGVKFLEISPGYFRMGSHYHCERGDLLGRICSLMGLSWGTRPSHISDECPPHWVEFREGFWISKYEVTGEQYKRLEPQGGRARTSLAEHPVTGVSWDDAREYCARLSERSGLPVRLPSEAEWECACRGGAESEYCFGDDEERLAEYVCLENSRPCPSHPVGSLKANAWNLFDLHGNVGEWCEDTYHESYEGAPSDGSAWSEDGDQWWESATPDRVSRGGACMCPPESCRSADRLRIHPASPSADEGFRPAFALTTDAERTALRRHMERTGQVGE